LRQHTRRAGSIALAALAGLLISAPGLASTPIVPVQPPQTPQVDTDDLTIDVEVVADQPSVPLGGTYRATVTVTNTSVIPVTVASAVWRPRKYEPWVLCEMTSRLDPDASATMDCESHIEVALPCDPTWPSVRSTLVADDGTRVERLDRFVIDVEGVPTECPEDPNPAFRVSARQDGPPVSMDTPSTAVAHVRNIGDVMLHLVDILFEPVDESLQPSFAIGGDCSLDAVLRPDETLTVACQLAQHEPIPCDQWMRPDSRATAFWDTYDGFDQFANVTGEAFLVDLEGVGPCPNDDGGSGGGGGGGGEAPKPTPPATDTVVTRLTGDALPESADVLALVALLAGVGVLLHRRSDRSPRRRPTRDAVVDER